MQGTIRINFESLQEFDRLQRMIAGHDELVVAATALCKAVRDNVTSSTVRVIEPRVLAVEKALHFDATGRRAQAEGGGR